MINKTKLDSNHRQIGNTCLLSNYAVCCNYFTSIGISEYFLDYFNEFELDFSDPNTFFSSQYLIGFLYSDPEFAMSYNTYFVDFLKDYKQYLVDHQIENFMTKESSIFVYQFHQRTFPGHIPYNYSQASSLDGYTFIKLLHNNINQISFNASRRKINLTFLAKNERGLFKDNELGICRDSELVAYLINNDVLINAFKDMHSYTIYCNSIDRLFYSHNTNDPANDIALGNNWTSDFNPFLIYKEIPHLNVI